MALETPPHPASPKDDIDAGVIEDARARQRLHRRIGGTVIAAALVAAALLISFGGGDSGGGTDTGSSGSMGRSATAVMNRAFQGAPVTQRDGYGLLDRACPLAPQNRYLPARAGCVEALRADLGGDGTKDLVIVYSVLSHRHPWWYDGQVPAEIAKDFVPERPYLEVVLPDGQTMSTQILGPRGTWASVIDFISKAPDGEILVEATRAAEGGADVAYGLRDGRLVAAGPALRYGGDSAWRAGFTCVKAPSPGVIQRTFDLIGPSIYGWWKETKTTYSWRGSRLVRTAQQTLREHGQPARKESELGTNCGSLIRET